MHEPTVLIFGAPASLGPDAESLASCFVYQLQQALHTRYGTASVLPLFAFFDEYQTLNMDIAGRLSAIVRGANGGLTVILQNISQIAGRPITTDPTNTGASELRTIFSNSAIRVCLHNADESTARFFSDEIGKHAIVVPGISDHYDSKGFGIFPSTWNRIHSQQVVARVDPDSIKRMEKHHALVYLSPAGDAEFGETKPFMCDLRGIEEIARLHLLHNVTGRSAPAGEAVMSTGQGAMPMSEAHGVVPPGSVVDAAVEGAFSPGAQPSGAITVRLCVHCGQPGGKGRFCIECGRPFGGASPGQLAQSVDVPAQTSTGPKDLAGQAKAGPRENLPPFARPTPAMPADGAPGEVRALGQTSIGDTADESGVSGLSPYSGGAAETQRAVMPAQAAPPANMKQRVPMPPQIAPPAGTTVPAMPHLAGQLSPPVQRQPVTSLIADPAKLGIQQPGRQATDLSASQVDPSGGGVEF